MSDPIYIYLKDKKTKIANTTEFNESINIDIGYDGEVIGVEILDFTAVTFGNFKLLNEKRRR